MWNYKSNNKNLNKGKIIQEKYFLFNKKIILNNQNPNGVYYILLFLEMLIVMNYMLKKDFYLKEEILN